MEFLKTRIPERAIEKNKLEKNINHLNSKIKNLNQDIL